jgi:hypothetical protein
MRGFLIGTMMVAVLGVGVAPALSTEDPSAIPGGGGVPASLTLKLVDASQYTSGCVAPCFCFAYLHFGLRGTMDMEFRENDGLFSYYDIEDITWTFTNPEKIGGGEDFGPIEGGGDPIILSGFGTYTIGGDPAITHRLELTLQHGDSAPFNVDSGFQLLGTVVFPGIEIVSPSGTECVITTVSVDAIALGDSDQDADVDLVDFNDFQLCFTGSEQTASSECRHQDFDDDGDVDLTDFAEFQLAFTGS